MSKPILINLIDSFIATIPKEQLTDSTNFYWDWIKRITELDKSYDTGYSLLGTWVKKEHQLSWHRPGLYFVYAYEYVNLLNSDSSNRRVRAHLVSIFDLDSEGIAHLLHSCAYEKGDYAVQCWSVIDRSLLAQTKPKPLPDVEKDQKPGNSETQASETITVNSAIALCTALQSQKDLVEEETMGQTKQTPLRDLLIRYAIVAQVDRRVRSLPTEQVDIAAVATKSFDWGIEYLFDIFRLDLSRELGVDWRLLPAVKLKGDWIEFYCSETFTEQDL